MNDIDKWAAEQSGVKIGKQMYTLPNGKRYLYPFTLNDARCREIVREYYHLETIREGHYWIANVWSWGKLLGTGKGKTIAKAELNCITAIYEASQ